MDEGSGDYRPDNSINYDKVGIWSWDVISIEDKDFVNKLPEFKLFEKIKSILYNITDLNMFKPKREATAKWIKCNIDKFYFGEIRE
jgi:hypothetical protein